MESIHPRIKRERITLEKMVSLYCRREHRTKPGSLCPECSDLLRYALERLSHCPFQADKSTCAKCTVHCYQPLKRQQIRRVMAYSGPLMLMHHPILTIRHLIDGLKPAPAPRRKNR